MNVSAVSNTTATAAATASANTDNAAGILMLRRTLDIQEQNAAQLLQAIPQPPASNPPHLGQTVNTFA